MSDQPVHTADFPGAGTPERVAWDMVIFMRDLLPTSSTPALKRKAMLDFYAECLDAARGNRNTRPADA